MLYQVTLSENLFVDTGLCCCIPFRPSDSGFYFLFHPYNQPSQITILPSGSFFFGHRWIADERLNKTSTLKNIYRVKSRQRSFMELEENDRSCFCVKILDTYTPKTPSQWNTELSFQTILSSVEVFYLQWSWETPSVNAF